MTWGARARALQNEFRQGLLLRDGPVCVLCSGTDSVEAAHIIARIAEPPELDAAGPLKPNVPASFKPFHRLRDSFMWYFDPARGVVLADALRLDVDLGETWKEREGTHLSRPTEGSATKAVWWPPASVWAAALANFMAAKVKRNADADDSPFVCLVYHKRFKRAAGVTAHKCGRMEQQLHTPLSGRSAHEAGEGE